LFVSLIERLALFWRINKSDTTLICCLAKIRNVDRVAIDNTCYAPVDTRVLQAKSERGGLERILVKNPKRTPENKQVVTLVSMRALQQNGLTHTYRFTFSSRWHFSVHITPCVLLQAVQSQPTDLILNGYEESLGLLSVLKGRKPPSTSRLRDGNPM